MNKTGIRWIEKVEGTIDLITTSQLFGLLGEKARVTLLTILKEDY